MALHKQSVLGGPIDHYYLCHYRPYTAGLDRLSQSLLRFKSGNAIDVAAWCSCAVEELNTLTLQKEVLVVRALTSTEVRPTENNIALDALGKRLQEELDYHYAPHLLSKQKYTRPLKQLGRSQRLKELHNIYQFDVPDKEVNTILILDDILTTGTTLDAIMTCIHKRLPAVRLIGFTLAASDETAFLNIGLSLESNTFKWQTQDGWVIHESNPDYATFELIKACIQNDFLD